MPLVRTLAPSLSLLLLLSFSLSGCKRQPCDGGGMAIDPRPLPEAWAELAPAPAQAMACHVADGSLDQELVRNFELGANPEEGRELWREHLTQLGWTVANFTEDGRAFESTYTRGTSQLTVYVSRAVTDRGWTTLTFAP